MSATVRLILALSILFLGWAAAARWPASPRDPLADRSASDTAPDLDTSAREPFQNASAPPAVADAWSAGTDGAGGLVGDYAAPSEPLAGPRTFPSASLRDVPRAQPLPSVDGLTAFNRSRGPAASSASMTAGFGDGNSDETERFDDTTDDQAAREAAEAEVVGAAPTGPRIHEIRDGDTLVELAEQYLGDGQRYIDIYEENRHLLPSPDVLPIGVRIVVPVGGKLSAGPPELPSGLLKPLQRRGESTGAR
ncbi:MAG TPA: hypothetical protein VGE52_04850 [Pirellulales bacterium]